MATQYTSILKLALPVTGELSGTWGDVVNNNITSMIEQAIAGLSTINTWTANAHTLTVADGTTSESRCAMLVAATGAGGTALTAAGEIICPAASKLYVLKNGAAYAVTLKTAAGTGVAVPAGDTAFLFCDGTNVNACVTTIVNGHISGNLTVDGNTTLGDANTDTVTVTAQFASDLLPSTDNARDLGSTAKSWRTLYCDTSVLVGNLSLAGNTLSSTDTNGNIVIAPNGTGDVQLDADTIRVGDSNTNVTITSNGTGDLILNTNAGTNSGSITIEDGVNGNIIIAPNGTGQVQITNAALDLTTIEVSNINAKDGTAAITIADSTGAVGISTAVTMSATTQNIALGTSQTTGTFTVGGASQTGTQTIGQSTKTHTLNLGTGATESGLTKTINLGTGGVATSTTAITVGSANGTTTTLNGTVTAATLNSTTIDTTNLEVTNVKAKDGTAALTLADSTGVATFSANPIINAGTANGVPYLNGSKVVTTGSALTFDGTNFVATGQANLGGASSSLYVGTDSSSTGSLYVALGMVSSNGGANPLRFGLNGSEQMRLTSTGLGIGTSSPGAKLGVTSPAATAAAGAWRSGSTDSVYMSLGRNAYEAGIGVTGSTVLLTGASAGDLNIYTALAGASIRFGSGNGVLAATLDSSGNLGLGVTPSAWNASGYVALEIGKAGNAIYSGTNDVIYSSNSYYNTSWKYGATGFPAGYYQQNDGKHLWFTAPSGTAGNAITFTQAMTLDASGNLGIGTTSPGYKLDVQGTTPAIRLKTAGVGTGFKIEQSNATGDVELNVIDGYPLIFKTTNTERARITSSGYFKAADNGASGYTAAGTYHQFVSTATASQVLIVDSTDASYTSDVLFLGGNRNTTNGSWNFFRCFNRASSAEKLIITDSGTVTNATGTYGTISDAKMKTDIVDAGSQWSDIKALRFRKFKMKDDPSGLVQLGVVAQEVELTSPGLVDEHADKDAEGNDLGTTTKSVKTSVLLMKAAVALQEAMARIEQLEAKVAALEGK